MRNPRQSCQDHSARNPRGRHCSRPLSVVSRSLSSTLLLSGLRRRGEIQPSTASPLARSLPRLLDTERRPVRALGTQSQHVATAEPQASPAALCQASVSRGAGGGGHILSCILAPQSGARGVKQVCKFGLVVKCAVRCHVTPTTVARIKQIGGKCWPGGETWTLTHGRWGVK